MAVKESEARAVLDEVIHRGGFSQLRLGPRDEYIKQTVDVLSVSQMRIDAEHALFGHHPSNLVSEFAVLLTGIIA